MCTIMYDINTTSMMRRKPPTNSVFPDMDSAELMASTPLKALVLQIEDFASMGLRKAMFRWERSARLILRGAM